MSISKIFISHSTIDRKIALEISNLLKSSLIETWLASESVDLGSNFAEKITEAISSSNYLLLLLSPTSISSPHVKREVSLAIDKNIPILPILLGEKDDFLATLPQEWNYWLAVVQVIPFTSTIHTAQVIRDTVNTMENAGAFRKKSIPGKNRFWIAVSFIALVSLVALLFSLRSIDRQNPDVTIPPTTNGVMDSNPKSNQTVGAAPKVNILNAEILKRLQSAGSTIWISNSAPNSEGLNEENIFLADECYAYIFGDVLDANLATEEINFTSNAYYSWMDTDFISGKTVIFVATYEDAPCANAAEKAFKWAPLDPNSENFIEAGTSPFARCVLASRRIYGGTIQENIGPCKFQFERDGKAIPEDYMNIGK